MASASGDLEDSSRRSDDGPSRVPSADELLAIDRASWRWLVGHARRALQDLPPTVEDPRLPRLRSAPAKKLVDGRARRDLAALLAVGGAPWLVLLERLRQADDVPATLQWLVTGEQAVATDVDREEVVDLRRQVDRLRARLAEADRDLDRVRERARRRKGERDQARAQVQGLQARLDGLEQELVRAGDEVTGLRGDLEEATRALERADRDTTAAVERERRRMQARIRDLEEELSELRRVEQQRREQKAARQRREEVARERDQRRDEAVRDQERAQAQAVARRSRSGPVARPGRPSELPEHVEDGSTEHARALLTPVHWLYVDGYNLVKTVRDDLPDEVAERAWLLPRLVRLAADHGLDTTVFWDGQAAAEERVDRWVVQRFSASDDLADDDIVFEVALAPPDQPIVVVTDDRELRARLSVHDVDLLHARAFGWLLQA